MSIIRIAIVIPSLSHGGAERVASLLANNWAGREGLEIHVYTFTKLHIFYELGECVRHFNFPIRQRPSLTDLIKLFFNFRKYISVHKIQYALSFMDKYNLFTLGCLVGTDVKVIVSDRNNPKIKPAIHIRCLKSILYPRAHGVIVQTAIAAQLMKKQTCVKNVEIIPNPVSPARTATDTARKNIILCVGRLEPEKGHAHIIRAFSTLSLPGWSLVILGEGSLRKELESYVKALKIEGRVLMPGVVVDVGSWYARSSLFVLPSLSEGFPNVLLEAMSYGVACVSFNCDTGPSEIITDALNGFLVPVGNEEELASKVSVLAFDAELRRRLGLEAVRRSADFSEKLISESYLNFCLSSLRDN